MLLRACKKLVDLQQGASHFDFIFCGWEWHECQVGEARDSFAVCFNGVSAFEGQREGSRLKGFVALGRFLCFVSSSEAF